MNIQQIKEIISNYNKLHELAKSKINVIGNLDRLYSTARGIEQISFDDETVYVVCDDSCMGDHDHYYFNFPVDWLSKTDEELVEIVTASREARLQAERKVKEDRELQRKKEVEQQELEQLRKLKQKYEYGQD